MIDRKWPHGGVEEYQQWLAEGGASELLDPTVRTHVRGGALDEIILQPQTAVPVSFLRDSRGGENLNSDGWNFGLGEDFFPAFVSPVRMIGGHFPVFLRLPWEPATEEAPRSATPEIRKFNLSQMTRERWVEKDQISVTYKENRRGGLRQVAFAWKPTTCVGIHRKGNSHGAG